MVDSKALKKVVIVGGGWAGARLAYELERSKVPLDVILVDTKEYFEVCSPCFFDMARVTQQTL